MWPMTCFIDCQWLGWEWDIECYIDKENILCSRKYEWGLFQMLSRLLHICGLILWSGVLEQQQFWPAGIVVACVCVCVSVCLSVCQSFACWPYNSWPIDARIIKFGPDMYVSWSSSSARIYKPRLFHSPDHFTVSTLCMYSDLGSRGYLGV